MQLKSFLHGLDRISEWSGRIFIWLIIPLTVLVVFEVISRRFFGSPHIWAPEVIDYLYGPYFMLVAAYSLLYKAHVSIDIIYQRFPPRARGTLDIITHLIFFFPFCIILFTQGIVFAQTSWSLHETSESAALGIVPVVKTVIPVTVGLLLIQGFANFIRSVILATRGKEI
jgi:TRAP-type mannitol/chloroaromatic compound transport system permease small subunit